MAGNQIQEQIRYATLVRAAPEQVYDAIATAKGMNGWFTSGAEFEARPGTEMIFRWKEFGVDRVTLEERGRVLVAVRPERFVFEWHPDKPAYATTVEIDFHRVEGGTAVRLVESGYEDTASGRRKMLECASGWGEALTLMKFYVEHGVRY